MLYYIASYDMKSVCIILDHIKSNDSYDIILYHMILLYDTMLNFILSYDIDYIKYCLIFYCIMCYYSILIMLNHIISWFTLCILYVCTGTSVSARKSPAGLWGQISSSTASVAPNP